MVFRFHNSLNAYLPIAVTLFGIIVTLLPQTKVLVAVSIMALQLSRESKTLLASSTTSEVSEFTRKAPIPISVTLAGTTTDVNFEPPKAEYPTYCKLFDSLMSVKSQELNACVSIRVTLFGSSIVQSWAQHERNAPLPIAVIPSGTNDVIHPLTNVLEAVSIIALQLLRESNTGFSLSTIIVSRLSVSVRAA